ncbi:MAG: amino acid adenylation domain-containing protein [Acidobacteriota bacterium]
MSADEGQAKTGAAVEVSLENLSAEEKKRLLARLLAAKQGSGSKPAAAESLPPADSPAAEGEEALDAPLTPAQERFWFFEELHPGQAIFHLPGRFRLHGELSFRALEAAFRVVWRRHEVLRSKITAASGAPRQLPGPSPSTVLPLVDLSALAAEDAEAAAQSIQHQAVSRAFDLAEGALLRAVLVRRRWRGRRAHELGVVLHHIAGDGWSQGVLIEELRQLYAAARGEPQPSAASGLLETLEGRLPELAVQYGDYAQWLRDALAGEALQRQLERWRSVLEDAPLQLELPTDRPRPALESHRGAVHLIQLDSDQRTGLAQRLDALAQASATTPFMVFFAAYSLLLSRLSGQRDLLVGTPVGGRLRPELEALVGCFSNVLVLRSDLRAGAEEGESSGAPGLTFLQWLGALRSHVLEGFESQQLPFEELVRVLDPERLQDRHPVYQALFVFHNTPKPQLALPGLEVEPLHSLTGASRVDLTLELHRSGDQLWGSMEYASDLFDATTVARWSGALENLLEAAVTAPETPLEELPWLSASQRHQLRYEWAQGALESSAEFALEMPEGSRAEGVWDGALTPEAVVFAGLAADPQRPAVQCFGESQLSGDSQNSGAGLVAGESWSAEKLARSAEALAYALRHRGVGPGIRVGIYLERSPRLLAAVLGVLRAGATYVPLDPRHPSRRLGLVVAEADLCWVLEEEAQPASFLAPAPLHSAPLHSAPPNKGLQRVDIGDLIAEGEASLPSSGFRVEAPWPAASPLSAAYILHTSGSTGRPKGVVVSRASVVAFLEGMARAPGFDAGGSWLAVTTLAFDISVLELLLPLARGGTVVLASAAEAQDGELLGALLRTSGASTLQATPVTWRLLLEAGQSLATLRRALCGGEAMPPTLARDLLRAAGPRGLELWNLYGPTETTVWSSRERVVEGSLADSALDSALDSGLGGSLDGRLNSGIEVVAVGRPCGGDRLWVVEPGSSPARLAPPGVAGELWIGGPGVARGYDHQPAKTALRFVPDPWSEMPGARTYRTGDRVRFGPDGRLHFLGRFDHQLKVRGVRMEAGEIERVLEAHPEVRQAVVGLAKGSAALPAEQLAAWLVPRDSEGPPSVEDLREHCGLRLTANMVPTAFVFLETLPLTPNRKIDRKALPAPELGEGMTAGDGVVPPGTELEALVMGAFAQALGVEENPSWGVTQSFFDLGGHSLLAHRVIVRLRESLELSEISIGWLFDTPSARELADRVERSRTEGELEGETAPPPLRALPRSPRGDSSFPLSFSQLRQWFLDQLEPGTPDYNLPVAVDLEGALDAGALHRALLSVAQRHEVLRTRFMPPVAGREEPLQAVAAQAVDYVHGIDLTALPEDRREPVAQALAQRCAETSFALHQLPLLRALVLRLRPPSAPGAADALHRLVLAVHHIVIDGWSFDVLLRETAAAYSVLVGDSELVSAEDLSRPPLEVQYGDYAQWQRELLSGERLERQLGYWREHLEDGGSPPLELPTDRPRPALQSFSGGLSSLELDEAATSGLRRVGARLGATLHMVLVAAAKALFYRLTGQRDLSMGTYVAGRSRPALEPLVGFFVNTLTLRSRFDSDVPFSQLLATVRRASLGALAHQDLPFEQLLEELAPQRDLSRTPWFQSLLVLQNTPLSTLELPQLTLRPAAAGSVGRANFDLTFWAREQGEGLVVDLSYNRDLFDASSIQRFLKAWRHLLAAVAEDPQRRLSALSLLDLAERRQLVEEWALGDDLRQGASSVGEPTPSSSSFSSSFSGVHEDFFQRAETNPERVAVETARDEDGFAPEPVTYGQLAAASVELAKRLRQLGAGPESVVAISTERCPEMVQALLAVFAVGAAFLPLDPQLPAARRRVLLEESGAIAAISPQAGPELLPAELRETEAGIEVIPLTAHLSLGGAGEADEWLRWRRPATDPLGLAYLLYTSGSTGKPKAVAVSHGALSAHTVDAVEHYGVSGEDRLLNFASLSFDASAEEIWPALTTGARLVLRTDATLATPADLADACGDLGITVLNLPTAYWHTLVASGDPLPYSVRLVIIGGEAAQPAAVERWRRDQRSSIQLFNTYGPTEATVVASRWLVAGAEELPTVPIGQPLDRARIYVLDRDLEPLPVGLPGEITLGGAGLARGYWRHPARTAEAFRPDPHAKVPGERVYRSGDLGRWRPDGELECLGRRDGQRKVRGYRIELGEVESVLHQLPAVAEGVAAVLPSDEGEGSRLVAWVVPREGGGGHSATAADLRGALGEVLPSYMVPSAIVLLPRLPVNAAGKVDRRALPEPERADLSGCAELVAPRDETEQQLAAIAGDLLDLAEISVFDSFFDLGGHSLLATRYLARIRELFAVDLPLRTLFDAPTVAALAAVVEEAIFLQLAAEEGLDLEAFDSELLDDQPLDGQPLDGAPLALVEEDG